MSDTVKIFGTNYTNVAGVVVKDLSKADLTYVRPEGKKTVTANGTNIDVTTYASLDVAVPAPVPNLQSKSATPTESTQTITADNGYDGLSNVSIDAISSTYVGSGIIQCTSNNLTVSDATVTAPAGYYASAASKAVVSGTAGTPIATKGTASNNQISITPSVTNTTGYITGGTVTGSSVTVSAGELVNGTLDITENGENINVTNYAAVNVDVAGSDGYVWQDANGGLHFSNEKGRSIAGVTLTATENGIYTPNPGYAYSMVTVNVEGGGGGSITPSPTPSFAEEKQVNFIDYDGTILHSYTATEANALTVLPANPSHTGLTAQGWNWTLAQIKAQLTAVPDGPIWVGQMYVTSSGDTEIDVSLPKERLSPYLILAVNGTVSIDWGDNTTADALTGTSLTTEKNIQHTYPAAGNYTIAISVTSGSFSFYNPDVQGSVPLSLLSKSPSTSSTTNATTYANAAFANCITAIRIGTNASIKSDSFLNCFSLKSITIPSTVTSIGDEETFRSCYSLKSVTIPSGVTSIGNYAFYYCRSLINVSIPSTVTSIGSHSFYYCVLDNITIPSGITSIKTYTFCSSTALAKIVIPNTITSIESYAFQNCYSLNNVSIPNGVTSINSNTFDGCYSFGNITIPSSVTSIATYSFRYCYGLRELHLLPTTPPTLANTNAFGSLPSDCIIYVPYSEDHSILTTYQGETNWSTYASRMQEEPQS